MAAKTRNKKDNDSILASASHAVVVNPSDGTDLTYTTTELWVGGAGNISLDTIGGETAVLFSGIPAGTRIAIQATRIRSTNTTATLIVALS